MMLNTKTIIFFEALFRYFYMIVRWPKTFNNLECAIEPKSVHTTKKTLISHKYRGSCVAFLISKSVEPNEELKVG
jgi:hypothetical protein